MKIKNALKKKNNKPLFGNNRSFSNRATRRMFATNKQKFTIGNKKYFLPVKLYRSYLLKLKNEL
jgi:ribosomal protein L28